MRTRILRRYDLQDLAASPLLTAFLAGDPSVTRWLGPPVLTREDIPLPQPGGREPLTIITGHQPQWLLGPTFLLYKAITVLAVARALGSLSPDPVRTVFWSHSDDSDTSEVDHVYALNPNWDLQRISLGRPPSPRPLYLQDLGEDASSVFRAFCEALPPTQRTRELLEDVEPLQHGTFADAFRATFDRIFAPRGLELVEPRQRRDLCQWVTLRAIDKIQECTARWVEVDQELAERSWAAPFPATTAPIAFLLDEDGRRRPLTHREGQWQLGGHLVPEESLREEIHEHPENVVPGALLRVLVQAKWFPNAVYVGGPNELAYHVYASSIAPLFDVHPPRLLSRLSVTLIERRLVELLERFHVEDPLAVDESELRRAGRPNDLVELERIDMLASTVRQVYAALANDLTSIDPSMARSLPTHAEPIVKQLDKTRQKIERILANHAGTGGKQVKRLVNMMRPRGSYQERCYSTFQLLAAYGIELIDELSMLDPFDHRHAILLVEGESER